MTRIWISLKKNLDIVLTIGGAVVVALLSLFDNVSPEIVTAATLTILSLIAISLLRNRTTASHLQQATEEILERLERPSIDQILMPYGNWVEEISQSLSSAREVWVLSRTCERIWEDYHDLLMEVLRNRESGVVRLMLVDPRNGAVKMIADSAEWDRPNNPVLLQAQIEDLIERMLRLCSQLERGSLKVRTIDYLPALTLILVNPTSEKGIAFVELGMFRADGRHRPTFSLSEERDKRLFWIFQNEFETMWKKALPIEET